MNSLLKTYTPITFGEIKRYEKLEPSYQAALKAAFKPKDEASLNTLKIDIETSQNNLEWGGNLDAVKNYVDAYVVPTTSDQRPVLDYFKKNLKAYTSVKHFEIKDDSRVIADLFYQPKLFLKN